MIIKLLPDSLSLSLRVNIDSNLDSMSVTRPRPERPPISVTADHAVVIRDEKRIALTHRLSDPPLHLTCIDRVKFKSSVRRSYVMVIDLNYLFSVLKICRPNIHLAKSIATNTTYKRSRNRNHPGLLNSEPAP